jgi:hypothetical protein
MRLGRLMLSLALIAFGLGLGTPVRGRRHSVLILIAALLT